MNTKRRLARRRTRDLCLRNHLSGRSHGLTWSQVILRLVLATTTMTLASQECYLQSQECYLQS